MYILSCKYFNATIWQMLSLTRKFQFAHMIENLSTSEPNVNNTSGIFQ